MSDEKRFDESRQYWDNFASSFDDEPDHGLRDPVIRASWMDFLRASLPYTSATVLDIGCGTGSLSVLMAGLGHHVTGIDFSPAMIALARTKASALGLQAEFHVMDAASPQLPPEHFDAILCRHLLWTLPEPRLVLQWWADLLKQRGRLVLIEGYWDTNAGLRAGEVIEMLPASFEDVSLKSLSGDSNLWGREVNDERYAILADKGL